MMAWYWSSTTDRCTAFDKTIIAIARRSDRQARQRFIASAGAILGNLAGPRWAAQV
jgi:hypothetical protein